MKRLVSLLLIAYTAILLSSCVIVTNESVPEPEPTYSFYFFNNSDYEVRDWYLLDKDNNQYSKNNDGYAVKVEGGEISKITGLKKRTYRVYYEYYDSTNRFHKEYTNYFDLDKDVTYKFVENTFYEGSPRSVQSAE